MSISRKKFASKFHGTDQSLPWRGIILLSMARKRGTNGKAGMRIPGETKRAIVVVVLVIIGLFLTLAAFGAAGIAGSDTYRLFAALLGIGYFLVPLLFFMLAGI